MVTNPSQLGKAFGVRVRNTAVSEVRCGIAIAPSDPANVTHQALASGSPAAPSARGFQKLPLAHKPAELLGPRGVSCTPESP
jgi:hypothetical protein